MRTPRSARVWLLACAVGVLAAGLVPSRAAADPLTIVNATLPDGKVGRPYMNGSFPVYLNATGGTAGYTWSLFSGSLPPGLQLDQFGQILGSPTTVGFYTFTLRVTDSSMPPLTADREYTVRIDEFVIVTESLEVAVIGQPYSMTVQTAGGTPPYSWVVLPSSFHVGEEGIPPGLALNSATGEISGTGTETGSWSFDLEVTDSSNPASTDRHPYNMLVNPLPTIVTDTFPDGIKDFDYNGLLQVDGGKLPFTFSLLAGALPPGLNLPAGPVFGFSTSILGTPTASGTFNFTLQVADGSDPPLTHSKGLSILINDRIAIVNPILPDGFEGQPYNATLTASGGTPPYGWFLFGSPVPGITFNAATATFSGTPAGTGTYGFPMSLTDSSNPPQGIVSQITVTIQPHLHVADNTLPAGAIGSFYQITLQAQDGTPPYAWSLVGGSLPDGLMLNPATGVVSGTPTTEGTFPFTVRVDDSGNPAQFDEHMLSVKINPVPLVITTLFLPKAVIGVEYSAMLAASGGTLPLAWNLAGGQLPPGVTLDAATGTVSGAPAGAGTFTFTVGALDSSLAQQSVTRQYSLVVSAESLGRNNTVAEATPISNGTFRASISPYSDPEGTLNPDMDVYEITGTGGSVVIVEIVARRLAIPSPLDAAIEILNSNGVRLSTCRPLGSLTSFTLACMNDEIFTNPPTVDPALEFKVPGSGPSSFYARVVDERGMARPDFLYDIVVSGANAAAAPPQVNEGGVVSAATFQGGGGVAPGSIVAVFGQNLAMSTASSAGVPLPTTLGGASMHMNGIAVPKFFASPLQINLQIPWQAAGQAQGLLTDTVDGVTGNSMAVNVTAFAPGLFSLNQQGTGQGAILIANTATFAAPVGSIPGAQSRSAVRGVDFLEIYCTGLGLVTNQPATGAAASANPLSVTTTTPAVTIGGVNAPVLFSGLAPGYVGLYVATLQLPANAPTGSAVSVVLTIGGVQSNTVTISVQ